MIDNPIVEEVHHIRVEMLEEFGGDIDALVDEIQRRKKEYAAAGKKVVAMPPRIPAPAEPIKKVG